MSKIRCFALGGLDELGKNLFVVEVNQDIFIFDCGLKILKNLDLGVNTLIPDFNYLVKHQNRIQGVFITKIDKGNFYALPFLLNRIKTLKVFVTKISREIIITFNLLSLQQMKNNLFVLENYPIDFDQNKMHFFYTATNLPGSCGFNLETNDGFIIYTGSFILETGVQPEFFTTQLKKMLPHEQKKVLLLISSCAQINSSVFTSPHNQVGALIQKSWQQTNRNLIVCCDQNDWYKIFSTIKTLKKLDGDAFVITFIDSQWGEKMIKLFNKYHQKESIDNYLDFNSKVLSSIPKKLIFVTGDEKWLFSRILRLVHTKKTFLNLTRDDFLLILGKSPFSAELAIVKSLNALWHKEAKIKFINNKKTPFMEAGAEDLRLIMNFLQPRYFFALNGYHKDLQKIYDIMSGIGLSKEQVFLQENGEIISFLKGKKQDAYEAIFTESVFVDNLFNNNVVGSVISERKTLGEEGIIFVILKLQKQKNKLEMIDKMILQSFGFTQDEIKLNNILQQFQDYIIAFCKKNVWMDNKHEYFIQIFKKEFSFIVRKTIRKTPFIFPILSINHFPKT